VFERVRVMGTCPKAAGLGRVTRALAVSALIGSAPETAACGYHDDVSLARGVLNWVYPDALYVVGALSAAVADGRLSARSPEQGGPALVGYHRTLRALDLHARQLRVAAGEMPRPTFALLLIEPMLWTRFVTEDGDMRTHVHVSGPQAGDLVVISGEEVLRAVADNRLTIAEAYRSGVMRLYGRDDLVSAFLAAYDQIGGLRPAP
jgi:hypothetical protein